MIKLFYYNGVPNVGDQLPPFIFERLFKCKTVYSPIPQKDSQLDLTKYYVGEALRGNITNLYPLVHQHDPVVLSVGSILSWGNDSCVYWGSGFMNETELFGGGRVLAVRGYCSQHKLASENGVYCDVVGDPALLLPLIVKDHVARKNILGLIPHYSEYLLLNESFPDMPTIICMRTKEVDVAINRIRSCKFILSSSLHGLIIAHSFGIPALWTQFSKIDIGTFKFKDYFSSVGIDYYDPIVVGEKDLTTYGIESLFNYYARYALPGIDIRALQRSLLSASPVV